MRLLIVLVIIFTVGCHATTETPSGKQVKPAALEAPTEIDFGVVDTGAVKDTTFELFNSGTEVLHVLAQHFSLPAFSVDSTTFDIIGRVTHPLTFRYTASDLNEHTATDTIVTNVANYVVPLHAKSTVPPDANDMLVLGTNDGVFLSSDRGYDWSPVGQVPGFGQVNEVFTYKGAIFALASNSLYRSTLLGASWAKITLPSTTVAVMAAFDSIMFASDNSTHVFSSTTGSTWISSNVGISVSCFAKMTDSNEYFCGGGYVTYTTSNGQNWRPLGSTPFSVTVVGFHNPYVFAGAPNDGLYRLNQSTFGQWQPDSSDVTRSGYYCFLATNKALYMLTSDGILRSQNNGDSWSMLSPSGYSVSDLSSSSVLKEIGNELLLGCNSGVYRSKDNGVTWTNSSTGLTSLNVNSISVLRQ